MLEAEFELQTEIFIYNVLHMYYVGDENANCEDKEIREQHGAGFAAVLCER